MHEQYHGLFKNEQVRYGFYDIFLIDKTGTIVYSVEKEVDYGTNLLNGLYRDTNLAMAFKKAINLPKKQVIFEDFKSYKPSFDIPSAFLSFPIDKDGERIGVLAVQVPIDEIDSFLSFDHKREESGLGESGEVYLVGEDFFMRSNSRFIDSSSVGVVKVNTKSVKQAIAGKSGVKLVKDYRGVKVYSAHIPIDVFGHKWAVLTDIDEEEILRDLHSITIVLFTLGTSIVFVMIIGFVSIIYFYFIKPLRANNISLHDNIVKLDKKVLVSQSILNEYKKAVDASSIVSKADINGMITYVNDEFCHISGYDFSELQGKSHNIIRHPDTPKELFKDLWKTIKNKKIWKGIIKNRTKDGRNYYVNSTIVPILDENSNIKEYMSIRSDVTDLMNQEKVILKQTTDKLTNLPNRIRLMEDIESGSNDLKLAIIHLNSFKSINDFYGTEFSDILTTEVAASLKILANIEQVMLYKIASDEFVLLSGSILSLKEFIGLCESIQRYMDHNSFKVSDDDFNVKVTIGIAADRKNIFVNAERARYNAEETSQGIICYDNRDDIQNNFENNHKWVTKIKEAIRNDKIVVFAQPIVSNTREEVQKYECLVRMIDSDGSIISPFYFLEIAKQARLYTTLTKIIIEKSFRHFSGKDAIFSVNLTIEDIINHEVVDYLRDAIKEYNVANQLVLEIVESEGIENFDEISSFISEMKELGCKFSIDDFGTGYSNFEYLMKLDVDYIKIDGSLIKNIDKDESAQIVVELIISFAKKLNRKTIAEYVHSEAVLKKVKDMRIDYSQGYFLGEPTILKS